VSVRELVGLAKNVAPVIQQDRFGRSRPSVDTDKTADRLAFLERRRGKFLPAVGFLEAVKFPVFRNQPLGAGLRFLLLSAELDVINQLGVALVTATAIVFALAKLNRTQGPKVLRVIRDFNQVFGLRAIGNSDFALLPHARNVCLPGLAHPFDEAVRSTQQQNVWPQGVAAG